MTLYLHFFNISLQKCQNNPSIITLPHSSNENLPSILHIKAPINTLATFVAGNMLLLPHCRHTKRGITFVVPRSRQLVPSLARSFVRSSWASVPLGCRVRVRVGQPKSELVVLGPVHRFVRSCCCSCASVLILWPNASVAFRCQFQCSGNFQARRSGSLANNEVNYTK